MSETPGEDRPRSRRRSVARWARATPAPDEPGGGPVDRPAGTRGRGRRHLRVDPQEPSDPESPDLQSGGADALRPTILVAGIGNLFLATTASAPRSSAGLRPTTRLPDDVRRRRLRHPRHAPGLRPARRYDALVLVDAVPGEGEPGDVVVVLEVGPDDLGAGELDAHGMDPVAVLGQPRPLGGTLPPTYVVGCRPASVEDGIGLSRTRSRPLCPVAADAVSASHRPARPGRREPTREDLTCASESPARSSR